MKCHNLILEHLARFQLNGQKMERSILGVGVGIGGGWGEWVGSIYRIMDKVIEKVE